MRQMAPIKGNEGTWHQPVKRRREYELLVGSEVLVRMRWDSRWRQEATAECNGQQWTLDRAGFLRRRVMVRAADTGMELATFEGSWDGGGTLTLADGRTYAWNNTNFLHTAWAWTDYADRVLLRFKGKQMTFEPDGRSLPELPLLASISWYLNILSKEEAQSSAAISVVV